MSAPLQLALFDYEREIEQALHAIDAQWRTIAANLAAIHEQRLYVAEYGTWAKYCQQRWGKQRRWAYQLVQAAEAIDHVRHGAHDVPLPESERQVRPLIGLPAEEQAEVWREAVERHGEPTGTQVAAIVEQHKTPHQLINQSTSNEWYTPRPFLDAAHAVMGGIDLDPASNAQANGVVRATSYYALHDDGFAQPWRGRVWLNPPYGREEGKSNQARWSQRLVECYRAGDVPEAILLVNASPGNEWFEPLKNFPICFPDGRIRFYNADGGGDAPTHSNALVYFGPQVARFVRIFSQFGAVMARVDEQDGRVFLRDFEVHHDA